MVQHRGHARARRCRAAAPRNRRADGDSRDRLRPARGARLAQGASAPGRRCRSRSAPRLNVATNCAERVAHLRDDARPIAERRLTEQARLRIPGASLAVERPAPIGRKRQHHPGRARRARRRDAPPRCRPKSVRSHSASTAARVGHVASAPPMCVTLRWRARMSASPSRNSRCRLTNDTPSIASSGSSSVKRDRAVAVVGVAGIAGPGQRDAFAGQGFDAPAAIWRCAPRRRADRECRPGCWRLRS